MDKNNGLGSLKAFNIMEKLLLALCLALAIQANTQSLGGVDLTGSVDGVINQYKNKGWKENTPGIEGASVLKGRLGVYNDCQMFIYATKAKQIAKIVIYLPEQDNWTSLRRQYLTLTETFVEKFGSPKSYVYEFITPYFEGDGFELQAVRLSKINIASYWLDIDGGNYGVKISKFKQVTITCENDKNMGTYIAENKKSIF